MNAAEHYKRAEDLIVEALTHFSPDEREYQGLIARAQAHATLALYREISDVTAEIHDLTVARESQKAV